jgi:hypothetical protein
MMVPPALIGLAVLFAVNRLVLPRFLRMSSFFWSVNIANLIAALWTYIIGFPGMEDQTAVRLLIGTLLLFHIAQNLALRDRERVRVEGAPDRRVERLKALKAHSPADGDTPTESG